MTTFPIQELTIRPGFSNQYRFTIENATAKPSVAAIELEQVQESQPNVANMFNATIQEVGHAEELAGPFSLAQLYADGYTTLSHIEPWATQEYLLTLTANQDLEPALQLQQLSFDMKVGIETIETTEAPTPTPTPSPSPTPIASPTPQPSPAATIIAAVAQTPSPQQSPPPSPSPGQVLGATTQTAQPPRFQQYLPLFLSLALLVGVLTFYTASIFRRK